MENMSKEMNLKINENNLDESSTYEILKDNESITEIKDIEQLRKELNVDKTIYGGVKSMNGWRSGKQISTKEFKTSIEKFLNMGC